MAVYEGELVGTGLKFGIVVSRWNDLITRRLLEGAEDGLRRHGVVAENIDIAWVPGSFELPVVCKRMAETGRYDGIIALGAVVTTENIEQAIERAGTKSGNKGFDAAVAAIEMANLLRQIGR